MEKLPRGKKLDKAYVLAASWASPHVYRRACSLAQAPARGEVGGVSGRT